jgi:hypothetical protein
VANDGRQGKERVLFIMISMYNCFKSLLNKRSVSKVTVSGTFLEARIQLKNFFPENFSISLENMHFLAVSSSRELLTFKSQHIVLFAVRIMFVLLVLYLCFGSCYM